ncbi:ABC transporter substrate-binding protein [Roseibium sp. MMSF_3544]|uniref:substrate-binding periplasmic protein n=1 Tax=unclassified Roseibium TaxID=2629323 RepID=UPI00273FA221|nr:transporter substrate-binding domain-containing protein [Roseibium sp. MMSF_3544]
MRLDAAPGSGMVFRVLAVAFLVCLAVAMAGPAKSQELRLITSPWPPSNFVGPDGSPAGISIDVIEALKEKLQLDTPVEILPWARGYLIAQSEPNVMLFTAGRTEERVSNGFHFIGPVVMWTHALMAKSGANLSIDDLDAVKAQDLTVAGVRGSWQMRLLEEAGVQTVDTENHETGARMLLAERVDLWITSSLQASVILKDLGEDADRVEPVHAVRRSPSFLMISKGSDPDVIARWENAYLDLKQTDFFENAAKKWSEQLGISLRFSSEDGLSAISNPQDKTGS